MQQEAEQAITARAVVDRALDMLGGALGGLDGRQAGGQALDELTAQAVFPGSPLDQRDLAVVTAEGYWRKTMVPSRQGSVGKGGGPV